MARQLLIKNAIIIYGNIIDACVWYVSKKINPQDAENRGFKKALSILVENGIITPELKDALRNKVWPIRNQQHIRSLPERELDWYDDNNYQEVISLFNKLQNQLAEAKVHGKF